jgi:hypothetical protein
VQARLTFADVSPPGSVVSFRLHEGTGDWLPIDPAVLDLMAGSPLIYSGDLTVLCHMGNNTPAVRNLLQAAGHRISALSTYTQLSDLEASLRQFARQGRKVVVSHIPAPGLLEASAYAVQPALLIDLNQKANLDRFCPRSHVIPREFVPIAAFVDRGRVQIKPPVVLKAATKLPTGAGFDVVICRNDAELNLAVDMFTQARHTIDGVVVELFKEFRRSWCAQVAIDPVANTYLGAAEQVCSPEGRWLGNYCGAGFQAPPELEEIAMAIARAGRAAGYRGFAGFDIGVDGDGSYWVFDLNFRSCGSLVQLLFHSEMCFDLDHAVSRNARFESGLDMSSIVSRLDPFIQAGQFVPAGAFDGLAVARGRSLVSGYLVACSAEAIEEVRSRVRDALGEPTVQPLLCSS